MFTMIAYNFALTSVALCKLAPLVWKYSFTLLLATSTTPASSTVAGTYAQFGVSVAS